MVRLVSDSDSDRLRYITSLGFWVGARFEVLGRTPFCGPVTVRGMDDQARPQVISCELAQSLISVCLKSEVVC